MSSISRIGQGLVFALLAAGLIGCGSSGGTAASLPKPKERLPGKWQGEMIVYEDAVQGILTPQQIEQLAQKRMGLEFAADGSMVTSAEIDGQAQASSGRWELVTEEGDLLTIKSIEQSGQAKDVNIEFDGADTFFIPLKTEVAELGAMRFTRQR
jgi:hypothetical protein